MRRTKLRDLILNVVPKNHLSWVAGYLMHIRLPFPLSTWSVLTFAKYFNINIEEAAKDISEYSCIGEFFTRKLKAEVRPIGKGLIHPVDAVQTMAGVIYEGLLFQAKNRLYTLEKLLGCDEVKNIFHNGSYITYYLCPRDYHRVHSPVSGKILSCRHIPGYLWPVDRHSVVHHPRLFVENERVVIELETENGKSYLVMVGATNVGKMTLAFDPDLVGNSTLGKGQIREKKYEQPITVEKGQELGCFSMGSTVIMVYQKSFGLLPLSLEYRGPVKVGESLTPPA